MEQARGKRKTIFVEDTEPDLPTFFKRPDLLPPWVIHVWLHSDRGITGDPNHQSQLTLVFFRHDDPSSIEGVVRDAINDGTLRWMEFRFPGFKQTIGLTKVPRPFGGLEANVVA
jgi:hypothetical protein